MIPPIDLTHVSAPSPVQPHDASASEARRSDAAEAAEKFEGLMLTNLLKSAFGESGESMFGNGPGAHIYRGFMETYLADHLARSGGLGLQDTLTRALGGDPASAPALDPGGEA